MDRAELARLLGVEWQVADERLEPIVVEEREPARFMEAFAEAVAAGGRVFLADPAWGAAERAQLEVLVRAATVGPPSQSSRGWLMIPSGGTSGKLKFARHDEETIGAAVLGFCAHFRIQRVNAVGVLPLHHVSGFMGWMRCAITGGDFVPCSWKGYEALEMPILREDDWVISLVPTQLQRLLGSGATLTWLKQFRAIFVSGGPVWTDLAESAARAGLPVALCYGMTETAAMVAALRPEEFLRGLRSCGTALAHAGVRIADEGVVAVGGESLFRGYWPDWREPVEFLTDDLGAIDEHGHLHILGRRDAVIITGGKKVHAIEVEAVLRSSGEFADVVVIGVPDPEWGEAVVACYPAAEHAPDVLRATSALAAHQRPKRFVAVPNWPRNEQGKVNRDALRNMVAQTAAE